MIFVYLVMANMISIFKVSNKIHLASCNLLSGCATLNWRRLSVRYLRSVLVVCAAMFISSSVAGNLYRWVDSSGKVQYTDQPPPASAKNVEQKNFGANVIEGDTLPYEARLAVKRNPVVLYATNCGVSCDKARALLKTRGIPYTAKNPETTPADAEALKKLAGALEVPVLVVGKKHLKGFEVDGWNSSLDDAGYPKALAGKGTGAKLPDDAPK